jgi:hypothetical protein
MSTILDALRKVEGEQRARNADARARLLFVSPQLEGRRKQRSHSLWFRGVGFLTLGFAVGAGLVWWNRRAPSAFDNQPAVSTAQAQREPAIAAPAPPAATVPAAPGSSPPAPPSSLPTAPFTSVTDTPPPVEVLATSEIPSAETELTSDPYARETSREASEVQRSPFVTAPPAVRSPAPTPTPTPTTPVAKVESPAAEVPDASSTSRTPPPSSSSPANTSLSFLQWSPEPERRIAFIKVNGGPLTLAHEGDTVGGFTVVEIRRDAVELHSGETSVTLQAPR